MTFPLTLWDTFEPYEQRQLEEIPFGHTCFYCYAPLITEADRAKHFQLADRISTGVGYCPNKEKSFK